MTRKNLCSRRSVLKRVGLGVAGATVLSRLSAVRADEPTQPKGNIKQSVCRWCYNKIPLDKLAVEAKKMGYQSIELLGAKEIKAIQPLGLTCAVMSTAG